MREIKFRAWDAENGRMVRPGNFEIEESGGHLVGWFQSSEDDDEERECQLKSNYELILLQFTGLLDKNGKEIYEGDIVQDTRDWADRMTNKGVHLIRFGVGSEGEPADGTQPYIGWCLGRDDDYRYETTGFTKYEADNFEVIGNIYENPELLEK
ncbi:conserved hypothetical protein [Azospirillaceae bacterium]